MTAQITNGTIDPNWVMVIMLGVIGVLLFRLLNKMDKKLDEHDAQLQNHEVRITVIEKEKP